MNSALKRTLAAALMAGLMLDSLSCHAPGSTLRRVTEVQPRNSCGIELANYGIIDYSALTPTQMKAEWRFADDTGGNHFTFIENDIGYRIHCNAITRISLSLASDDEVQSDTSPGISFTSLGKRPDSQSDIGNATVVVNSQTEIDGTVRHLLKSANRDDSDWAMADDLSITAYYGQPPYLFTPGDENGKPIAFQSWTGNFQILTRIKKTVLEEKRQKSHCKGSFTLTLSYP